MTKLVIKAADQCRYDFVALGALVRRFDPGIIPLHEASLFESHCSGGEYNPAAALSKCFGLRTALTSANVRYPTGWWIESKVREAGVQAHWKWFDFDGVGAPRIANTYSDRGYGVRGPEVWYDRANEAAALLKPGDFDWRKIFELDGARWFHSGGIFAALSPSTSALIIEAMIAAKANGTVLSYDLNFRKKLWDASNGGSARAPSINREIAGYLDVLIGNEEDLQLGLGIAGPKVAGATSKLDTSCFREMIDKVRELYPNIKAVATTLREVHSTARHSWKAVLWLDGQFYESPSAELEIYDRIGGGDGFASGLIYGLLSGESPEAALRLGWAHGALLTTTPGDVSMVRLEQVKSFGNMRVSR